MDVVTSVEIVWRHSMPDAARHLAWTDLGLVIARDDGHIVLVDDSTAGVRHVLDVSAPPTALAAAGEAMVVGGLDGSLTHLARGVRTSWHVAEPIVAAACVRGTVIVGHGTSARAVVPHPIDALEGGVGSVTAIGCAAGRLAVIGGTTGLAWVDTGLLVVDGRIDLPTIVSVAHDPRERVVACGDLGGSIHVLRPGTGEANELTGYPDRVDLIAFAASGRALCACASDEMTVWPVDDDGGVEEPEPRRLVGHDEPITALAASEVDDLVVTGDASGLVRVWAPLLLDRPVATLRTEGVVLAISWRPDGRGVAISSSSGTLLFADVRPGAVA